MRQARRHTVMMVLLIGLVCAACGATVAQVGAQVAQAPGADAPADPGLKQPAGAAGVAGGAVGKNKPGARPTTPTAGQALTRDEIEGDGFARDRVSLELEAGAIVRVWTRAGSLDTTLRLEGPGGLDVSNDDVSEDETDSLIHHVVPVTGVYTATVSSYEAGDVGSYELEWEQVRPEATGTRFEPGGAERTLRLIEGTPLPGAPAPATTLWFEAEEGERITLQLSSGEVDTVVRVTTPDGGVWFNDDATNRSLGPIVNETDSVLDGFATVSGWYALEVWDYNDATRGAFTLRSSRAAAPRLDPAQGTPAGGFAGAGLEGRMFGLFVGITEYDDEETLEWCAEDAQLLAEAFEQRGLMSGAHHRVLTNSSANRKNIAAALTELSAQMGPNDTLVVFFSGHGGTTPDADGDELDGVDEHLVLSDGDLTDDRLVELLDGVPAGMVMLAIDACQAGGFARDFVNRPGRVGVFSSDEDVLSGTAEPLEAGGFLSYYLREGVLGAADLRPRDGALRLGELTDYLQEGFIASHHQINTDRANEPLQRLVIERGAHDWQTLLWSYPRDVGGAALPSVWRSGREAFEVALPDLRVTPGASE